MRRGDTRVPRFISGNSSPPEHPADPPSSGATTTEPGRQREVWVVRGSSSAGVSSGTRRQSCGRLCAQQWRDKERKRAPGWVPEREVARFFPTAWKNQPPTSRVPWRQAAVAAAWKRRAAGCGGDEKRGRRGLPRVVSVVAGGGSLKNTPQPHRAAPPQKPPSSTAEPKRDRAS